MSVIRALLSWIGRKAILYTAIFTAILVFAVWTSGDVGAWWKRAPQFHAQQIKVLETVAASVEEQRTAFQSDLAHAEAQAQRQTVQQLNRSIESATVELQSVQAAKPADTELLFSRYTLDLDAIREEEQRKLREAFLTQKIQGLERAREAASDYQTELTNATRSFKEQRDRIIKQQQKVQSLVETTRNSYVNNRDECVDAGQRLRNFDRSRWQRSLDYLPFRDRHQKLLSERDRECGEARKAFQSWESAKARQQRWQAVRVGAQRQVIRAQAWIEDDLPETSAALVDRIEVERDRAANTADARVKRLWARYDGPSIVKKALIALGLIIVMPFLIRLFCYFVLAPIAMRRDAIRLRVPDAHAMQAAPAERSAPSVAVRLSSGEELLVRQDYLQTSSHAGSKGTQWWLDWRKPFTSIATGLTFLTRIRGDGEVTTVSAVKDGLAEVTILDLPSGAACVLQPRAIAAVAKPIKRRLLITSHWRLGSLNAWLTMQLRYLVFHGPARLILKGGRGIRIEPAEQGRIFGQDQLVGFSADLAYSVSRTETFWPYFFGREQLLKDRILGGNGVLIIEEAPYTARRGEVRKGLEGMIDAGMKVFGL